MYSIYIYYRHIRCECRNIYIYAYIFIYIYIKDTDAPLTKNQMDMVNEYTVNPMILVSMFTHVQKYFECLGAYIDHLPNDFKCANTWKLWWIHEFFPNKNSSRNGSVLETIGKPVHHVLHEAGNDLSKICLLRVKPDALPLHYIPIKLLVISYKVVNSPFSY